MVFRVIQKTNESHQSIILLGPEIEMFCNWTMEQKPTELDSECN